MISTTACPRNLGPFYIISLIKDPEESPFDPVITSDGFAESHGGLEVRDGVGQLPPVPAAEHRGVIQVLVRLDIYIYIYIYIDIQ